MEAQVLDDGFKISVPRSFLPEIVEATTTRPASCSHISLQQSVASGPLNQSEFSQSARLNGKKRKREGVLGESKEIEMIEISDSDSN